MPPKKPANQSAECEIFLRIDFSGAPEVMKRDITMLRKLFQEFLLKRAELPTAGGGMHFIIADGTDEAEAHIGQLAGISGSAIAELLTAVQNAKGPIDLKELFAQGQYDDPEPITSALKEMNDNLAAVKKLLWKKRKKRT